MMNQRLSSTNYLVGIKERYTAPAINFIVDNMANDLDKHLSKLAKHPKSNLTADESNGLKWLNSSISEGKIAIVPADKGGATLIVPPEILRKKTLAKLNNTDIYEKIVHDPNHSLYDKLNNLWISGKDQNLVTPQEAKEVVGISHAMKEDGSGPTNRPSTLPIYKPGKPYFYPSPKIHKLNQEELVPGVEPPIRLITALQEGVTKRSDVYITDKYLRPLEVDFCQDLLLDTNDTLLWLDQLDSSLDNTTKKSSRCFSFDFKALYDSLNPNLVIEALQFAMNAYRPEWSEHFKTWITDLIKLSMESSVGMYEDTWYRQCNGVPTGGTPCVQLANIAVYYVLSKTVYNSPELMKNITAIKRYIDDGVGVFNGTKRIFADWITQVNSLLKQYGLNIDEWNVENPGNYVSFLDIKFCFDVNGILQTDLHIKDTDARSYLFYGSAHPNHIYAGIVYSQCLRLRRIINNTERLNNQLQILKNCFFKCNYPKNMVTNISNKVSNMTRIIKLSKTPENVNPKESSIRIVSTCESDSPLINVITKHSPILSLTKSFHEKSVNSNLFQFVKRTGPSLKNKLVSVKDLAMGSKTGKTKPCGHRNCKCCDMISELDKHKINNKVIIPASGTCASYNVIYCFICQLCTKKYVGRTVNQLNSRTNQYRSAFYRVISLHNASIDLLSYEFDNDDGDLFSLGLHLAIDHSCFDRSDLNRFYRVFILQNNCNPASLEVIEHKYIHNLKTLKPFGLNSVNPFSIPLLN